MPPPPLVNRSDEDVPAEAPPPGVKSNFENPDSRAGAVVATNIVFILLSAIALLLRLYTRRFIVNLFSLPDCRIADKTRLEDSLTVMHRSDYFRPGISHPGRVCQTLADVDPPALCGRVLGGHDPQ